MQMRRTTSLSVFVGALAIPALSLPATPALALSDPVFVTPASGVNPAPCSFPPPCLAAPFALPQATPPPLVVIQPAPPMLPITLTAGVVISCPQGPCAFSNSTNDG